MIFQDNAKPIYLQIADRICDQITDGAYLPESRIPSVREYAATLKVNANTVMRSYDYLASNDIIYNKRGLGYFICPGAHASIEDMRKRTFFCEDLPYLFSRLKSMGITPDGLKDLYIKYYSNSK